MSDDVLLNLVVTNKGRANLVNDTNDGTAAVRIAKIGLGSGLWTPNESATRLKNEFKRIDSFGGVTTSKNSIHVTIHDTSTDNYTLGEFGLYDENGQLFGIYAQQTPIMKKDASGILMLSADLFFESVPAGNVVIDGDWANFPQAQEDVIGVAKVATRKKVIEGKDDETMITPLKLRQAIINSAVPRPNFHLPLVSDIHIKEGGGSVNFSRASKATFENIKDGLEVSEIDYPRFKRDGLFMEAESTNLLTFSNSSKTLPPLRAMRVDTTVNPNGGVLGTVNTSDSGSKWFSVVALNSFGKAGDFLSGGLCFKDTDGLDYVNQVSIFVYPGDDQSKDDYEVADIVAPEDGFKPNTRYVFSGQTKLGEIWNKAELRVGLNNSTKSGKTVAIDRFQLEMLPEGSSFIPTLDSPATRLLDNLVMDGDVPFSAPYTLSFCMKATGYKGEYPRLFRFDDFRFESRADDKLEDAVFVFSEGEQVRADKINLFEGKRITLTRGHTGCKLFINGELFKTSSNLSRGDSLPLEFGFDADDYLFATIKDFYIWSCELQDEQVAALGGHNV